LAAELSDRRERDAATTDDRALVAYEAKWQRRLARLQRSFPDDDELQEEIRITVLHELAHYFGIDEDRLDELGYG
jgi:predicted Zn-dependent protease with MMP-like domain